MSGVVPPEQAQNGRESHIAAPVLSLARLRERAEEGHADLADETSSVISRDEFIALIEIAEDAVALLDQHISEEQRREIGRRIIARLT